MCERNVNIATIDSSFLTPQFVHEELVLEMLLAGINPKGKNFSTYLIYDQSLCYSKTRTCTRTYVRSHVRACPLPVKV